MAGRGRPAGLKRFYVYTFSDKGEVIYVGKGTGRRFKLQSVRFGCDGQILRHFESEAAAYKFEATLIAKLKPSMNKVAGGGGAITQIKHTLPAWFKRQCAEIDRIGSRVFVARELLKLDIESIVSHDQLRSIRRVANAS